MKIYYFDTMSGSEGQKYIPMHFIWIERGIQDAIRLRKSLEGIKKKEKIKIAQNLALDNMFMLKRNHNICFSNLIYQKIVEDKDKFDSIIREISKILVDSFMDEKSLIHAIESKYLRAEIFDSSTTITDFIAKSNNTQRDALRYLQKRWEAYMDQGDIEEAIATEAYLREYLTGIIHYEILFSKSQLYEGVTYPQRYTYHAKSFCITSIENYRLYQNLPSGFPNFLGALKTFFAKPLQKKLYGVMKTLFEIDEDSEIEYEYNVFINRLLSIASLIYFKTLSTADKINLLNKKLSLEDLVNSILEKGVKDFKSWFKIVDCLNEYSFWDLAQKFIEPFQPQISDLDITNKMVTYELIAKIYKNQQNYNESLKYLHLALECFNGDENNRLNKTPLFELLLLSEVAEETGKSSDMKNLDKILSRLDDLLKKILDVKDKYEAIYRISKVFKFLERFEEERAYLKELIDLNYKEASLEWLNYIDLRIELFYTSKMSSQKLRAFNKQDYFNRRLFEAYECFKHLYLYEAKIKFREILSFLHKNPEVGSIWKICRQLGVIYLSTQEYQKSIDNFAVVLNKTKDLESVLYNSIVYWMMGEKEKSKESLQNLPLILKNTDDQTYAIFDHWLLITVNLLGIGELKVFFQFIFDTNLSHLFHLWINIGQKLADFGFSQSAQLFINLSLGISESDQQKALCYNILGTILANKDNHNDAIIQYLKALKLDRNYILCFQNLGRLYMHKHDFQNAIRNFKKALDLASISGYSEIEIISIKSDLSYCESYNGNSFNIDRITSKKVKNALISAERIYLHFYNRNDLLDASSIINNYSKAIEIMLHEQISPIFNSLIEKYRENYFKFKTSNDFHIKFGNLFRKKTINLGVWSRILQDFQKEQKDSILEDFRKCLTENISDEILNSIKLICDFISPIRNPLTHQENISLQKVITRRLKIIELFNNLTDKLYPA